MKQICKHCSKRDIRETAPNLSIDLSRVIESKMVPSTGTEPVYNEIMNPSDISGRVRDVFEAIDTQRATLAQGKVDAANAKAAAEAASATLNNPSTTDGGAAN